MPKTEIISVSGSKLAVSKLAVSCLFAGGLLVGCTGINSGAPSGGSALTPAAPQNQQVVSIADLRGEWRAVDAAGKEAGYRATFLNGKFVSYADDRTSSDELLAKGTYQANSVTDIKLEFVGASSGANSADCKLVEKTKMNCTLRNGTPIFFKKSGAAA